VTVVSNGSGGSGFSSAPGGGGTSANANLQVREITLQSMTPTLSVSTGDPASARTIGVNFAPSDVSVGLRFSVTVQRNVGGTAQATLTVPAQTGNGSVTPTVKAGPSGSSGVFTVRIETPGVRIEPPGVFTNGCEVRVPPQILIQMLAKEAFQLSSPVVRQYLAWAIRNRFGDRKNFAKHNTYEGWIRQNATINDRLFDGPEPELSAAAEVFAAPPGAVDPTQGCQGFWTPTARQWSEVQRLLNSATTAMPTPEGVTGISFFYEGGRAPNLTQIVYFPAVGGRNDDMNTPAFLFIRQRTPDQPAAVKIQ
jgi:hypothetical protein